MSFEIILSFLRCSFTLRFRIKVSCGIDNNELKHYDQLNFCFVHTAQVLFDFEIYGKTIGK